MTPESLLLQKAHTLQGLTFLELAKQLGKKLPVHILNGKGWVGSALETYLGASGRNQPQPDFVRLGIELKTLPFRQSYQVVESTFVTHIPLLTIHRETWKKSTCFAKLRRVLWVPIEGDHMIPYAARRIGQAFLWSPSPAEEALLQQDWLMLTHLINTGRLHEIHARFGEVLQIRPKAADGKALCAYYDEEGHKKRTLPRGFYLRASFTQKIFLQHDQ